MKSILKVKKIKTKLIALLLLLIAFTSLSISSIFIRHFYITTKQNPILLAKSNQAFSQIGTFIEQSLNGKQEPSIVQYKGTDYIISASKVPISGWLFTARLPYQELKAPIITSLFQMLGIIILIFIIADIIAIFFARRISTPLRNITTALQSISEGDGDLTASLPVNGNDEIAHIAYFLIKLLKKYGHQFYL